MWGLVPCYRLRTKTDDSCDQDDEGVGRTRNKEIEFCEGSKVVGLQPNVWCRLVKESF
jgi:hypothetical protein